MKQTLTFSKETKNTVVFATKERNAPFNTLYIQKADIPFDNVDELEVEVTVEVKNGKAV